MDLNEINKLLCTHTYVAQSQQIGSTVYTAPYVEKCIHCGDQRMSEEYMQELRNTQQVRAAYYEQMERKKEHDAAVKREQMRVRYGIK